MSILGATTGFARRAAFTACALAPLISPESLASSDLQSNQASLVDLHANELQQQICELRLAFDEINFNERAAAESKILRSILIKNSDKNTTQNLESIFVLIAKLQKESGEEKLNEKNSLDILRLLAVLSNNKCFVAFKAEAINNIKNFLILLDREILSRDELQALLDIYSRVKYNKNYVLTWWSTASLACDDKTAEWLKATLPLMLDRAKLSTEETKLLCQMYCDNPTSALDIFVRKFTNPDRTISLGLDQIGEASPSLYVLPQFPYHPASYRRSID